MCTPFLPEQKSTRTLWNKLIVSIKWFKNILQLIHEKKQKIKYSFLLLHAEEFFNVLRSFT